MSEPTIKKNGNFFTGYVKEILTGLLFISVMWVGNSVSAVGDDVHETKTGIALLNKDVVSINEKLSVLTQKMDKVFQDRYTGSEAKIQNGKFRVKLDSLKDKVHALEIKNAKLKL